LARDLEGHRVKICFWVCVSDAVLMDRLVNFFEEREMKKILLSIGILSVAIMSSPLHATTGEWWEVSGKMEMEGMPFAMPAQSSKVCMPKGGEADPRYTQGKDSNCKMTDVKNVGNTVKFKGTCVSQGETMNVAGETTHDGSSFKSNMKMTGKSRGEPINMTMVSTGKRIGGTCDTEEMSKKAQAQVDASMAAACDTSRYQAINWMSSPSMFIGAKPTCPGKKEALCKAVKNEVPRDLHAFQMLERQVQEGSVPSIVKECGLNFDSMKKSVCKANARKGPLHFLEASCPAEAKAYRELMRKTEECEGRGFTSGGPQMKKCMGGVMLEEESESAPARSAKSGKSSAAAEEAESSSALDSDVVREGTKALKGLFGF
jgi:hypothetical protein